MKKIILFALFFFQIFHSYNIETERTTWIPWTTAHSSEWEIIEQNDITISHFRRNEFNENINALITRDTNWLHLCKHIADKYGTSTFFPNLGFAIIRTTDQLLIGTIRIKLGVQPGTLSFSYGLRPEVRHDKYGQEIMKAFTTYLDNMMGMPMLTLKIDKNVFMAEWLTEGIKENPDFDYLTSFFQNKTYSLEKIIGSVDISNTASLAILVRNAMQPFAVECNKYILTNNSPLFNYDFLLQYPTQTHSACHEVEILAADILSRDNLRIQSAYHYFSELFNIGYDWQYAFLSRAEKILLQLIEKKSSRYDCIATKNIITHTIYPPYCFIE
jgi:RimJ/RimL family protein N-acetyltransferase